LIGGSTQVAPGGNVQLSYQPLTAGDTRTTLIKSSLPPSLSLSEVINVTGIVQQHQDSLSTPSRVHANIRADLLSSTNCFVCESCDVTDNTFNTLWI